jgi:hypothetical protein
LFTGNFFEELFLIFTKPVYFFNLCQKLSG